MHELLILWTRNTDMGTCVSGIARCTWLSVECHVFFS